jgi:rhodanese-related sulfurtransferase
MEVQKPVIIQALWQIPIILLAALLIGVGFNNVQKNRLPLICNWSEQQIQQDLTVPITEAARLFKENKAVFLDARNVEFYNEGHIRGAFSLSWQNVDEQCMEVMDRIPPDSTIITYCDGPACDLSHMLAKFMKDMGFEDVHVLANGWTLWKQNKLPVEGSE